MTDTETFEAGWMAAKQGKPFLSLKKASIAWRNGYREFYASHGIKLSGFFYGYSIS